MLIHTRSGRADGRRFGQHARLKGVTPNRRWPCGGSAAAATGAEFAFFTCNRPPSLGDPRTNVYVSAGGTFTECKTRLLQQYSSCSDGRVGRQTNACSIGG